MTALENTANWAVEQVWGSDRFYNEGDVAEGQYAFVIDSGVTLLDDLNVHTDWSRSFVDAEPDPHDGLNPHGTAVASLIGAKANGQGLTGVAPGAWIVALKALNQNGWGRGRDIEAALAYARDTIIENDLIDRAVVNLSLGGGQPSRHPIVREMADLGIKIVVSAGNSARDADGFSPASYGDHENVYTISSNTQGGSYSDFTNFDGIDLDGKDDVDFTAGGTAVPTYSSDGSIRNRNGTSFSAPLVAGVLLMSEEVRPGQTFELSDDQREKGMIPDPLAMFDPCTYKHGPSTGEPAPAPPAESIPPVFGEPIYIEVPGPEVIIEVPVPGPEVIIEKPVYIEVPVPGPEVIIEKPIYIEVPGPEIEVPVPGPEVIIEVPIPVEVPVPTPILRGEPDAANKIKGTQLDEVIAGGSKRDRLRGGGGDDVLLGLGGGDKIKGGAGDDLIDPGTGKAKVSGGEGSDTFVLSEGRGHVKITDFDATQDFLAFDGVLEFLQKPGLVEVLFEGDLLATLT